MAIKINPAPLHMAQAVLVGISAIMSLCILSTSAHTLAVYNKQHTFNPWWLYLWPQHFNVGGTKWLLGSSVSVFVLSLVFLAFNLIPRLSMADKPTPRALLSLATLVPSALLSLVTVVYAHILNNNSPDRDTIQTWTCKYKNGRALEQDIQLPGDMGNGNFGALCRESKFALWGSLVVLLILGVGIGLTFVSWAADKWAARAGKKEKEIEGAMQG